MSSLRIVHVLRAPVGGLFRHVRDLALEQTRCGHSVGLIVDGNSTDSLSEARLAPLRRKLALGVETIAMPRQPGPGDIAAIRKTGAVLSRIGPDVVHGHGAKGGLYARAAACCGGGSAGQAPVRFYTPHGGSLHFRGSRIKGALFAAAERFLLPRTDGLIFESAFARDAFDDYIGIGETTARVIHNGLLDAEFETTQPSDKAYDFVFVGELRHLKGVDVLLRALADLNKERRANSVIVGDGPDRGAFEALRDKLGLSRLVTFTGAKPAREAFELGRSLVMPSRAESLPYVALEAAAAGLALIATDVGGVGEIVAGSDTSLVPADDVNALKHAMAAHLHDPGQAKDKAQRLREIVKRRFAVQGMTHDIEAFYRSRLSGRTSAATGQVQPAAALQPGP